MFKEYYIWIILKNAKDNIIISVLNYDLPQSGYAPAGQEKVRP